MSSWRPLACFERFYAAGGLSIAGTLLLASAGIFFVVRTVDVEATISHVATADPLLLGAAVGIYGVSWPIRGRRYAEVLQAMDRRFGINFLTGTVFLSQTANLLVPARAGDGIRAYLLNERDGTPYSIGAASLAVERTFDLVAITALATVASAWFWLDTGGVIFADFSEGIPAAIIVGATGCTLSILTVAIARSDLVFDQTFRRLRESRVGRLIEAVVTFGAHIRTVATNPRAIGAITLGSLVVWGLDILSAVAVLAALTGGELAWGHLLAVGTIAVSVGNLAKVFPLSQGGIGLYEAAFTGLVVSISPIGMGTAVAAAILDHGLKNVLTLAGGIGVTSWLGISPAQKNNSGQRL